MNYVHRTPQIAGIYLTDASQLALHTGYKNFWIPEGDQRFLPLLNQIEIRQSGEFKFATTNDENESIETHNRKAGAYPLNRTLMARTKMNVATGDFTIGGTRLVLNFTGQPIAAKTRLDIPKLFFPIENKQLENHYGKILVLSFHSFNTPEIVAAQCGLGNYFQLLLDEMTRYQENNPTKRKILEHLNQSWTELKKSRPGVMESSTIKVCLVHEYTAADFVKNGQSISELYCTETGISMQYTNNPMEMSKHPKLQDDLVHNKQIVSSLRENGISCFIVDNNQTLGDRFINFAGTVKKIPKVVSKNQPEGLYIIDIDGNKALNTSSYIKLTDIDTSAGIFKSQEEAQYGGDIRQQAQKQFEMDKLELSHESLTLKHEYDERIRQMDLENKARHLEQERQLKAMEAEYQKQLQALRLQNEQAKSQTFADKFHYDYMSMERKNYYDQVGSERKYQYESGKYERDSFLETTKTVGSIAGLLAGGFVLYRQLNK